MSDAALLRHTGAPGEAYAVFYRRHVDALVRFCARRGLDADDAADVVSETFLAALRQRQKYRQEREDARLWLLAIASRRVSDLYRRSSAEQRRNARLTNEQVVLSQADRERFFDLLGESDDRALDALADLKPAQQQAIRQRVLEERRYAEIAQALGISEPATRQHVSRGLAQLRSKLKELR